MRSMPLVLAGVNEQFIANVAHQLRHPLVPMRNAAALLKRDTPDMATIRRVAEIIERQTDGMHRLIGDLVDVSRLELGTLPLHPARMLLGRVIEQALEASHGFALDRGHELSVSVSTAPVFLQVDAMRVTQALHHIIVNACKYTARHGRIFIRAQQEGSFAVITVSDTGTGIRSTDLETIFGLWVQSEHGTGTEPGLGVGLYLARHLIAAHAGTVTASSDGPGHGSVFTVKLRCEAVSAAVF
jgi:two-component system, sensor histidine kinase